MIQQLDASRQEYQTSKSSRITVPLKVVRFAFLVRFDQNRGAWCWCQCTIYPYREKKYLKVEKSQQSAENYKEEKYCWIMFDLAVKQKFKEVMIHRDNKRVRLVCEVRIVEKNGCQIDVRMFTLVCIISFYIQKQ